MNADKKDWLKQVAENVVQAERDRGGAPISWLARVAVAEQKARAEFGNVMVDAAIEKARSKQDE